MSGRPAPRYADTGVVLVYTQRARAYIAGMRYTPPIVIDRLRVAIQAPKPVA